MSKKVSVKVLVLTSSRTNELWHGRVGVIVETLCEPYPHYLVKFENGDKGLFTKEELTLHN